MFLYSGRYEETTAVWENDALRPTQVEPDKYTMSLIVSAYTKSSKPHTGKCQTCRCWNQGRSTNIPRLFFSLCSQHHQRKTSAARGGRVFVEATHVGRFDFIEFRLVCRRQGLRHEACQKVFGTVR